MKIKLKDCNTILSDIWSMEITKTLQEGSQFLDMLSKYVYYCSKINKLKTTQYKKKYAKIGKYYYTYIGEL